MKKDFDLIKCKLVGIGFDLYHHPLKEKLISEFCKLEAEFAAYVNECLEHWNERFKVLFPDECKKEGYGFLPAYNAYMTAKFEEACNIVNVDNNPLLRADVAVVDGGPIFECVMIGDESKRMRMRDPELIEES